MYKNITCILILIFLFSFTASYTEPQQPKEIIEQGELVLNISNVEKDYLIKTARAALVLYITEKKELIPENIPENLKNFNQLIFATLWCKGQVLGCFSAKEENIVLSAIKAINNISQDPEFLPNVTNEDIKNSRIEITITGDMIKCDNTSLEKLEKQIELGINGIYLEQGDKKAIFKNTVPITRNYNLEYTLKRLSIKAGLPEDEWKAKDTKIFKFLTLDLIESTDYNSFHQLYRGNILIDAKNLKKEQILNSCLTACDWLERNQNADGSYQYLYFPSSNTFGDKNSIICQTGACYAMARFGKLIGSDKILNSAERAADYLLSFKKIYNKEGQLYAIYDANNRALLGTSGLLLAALCYINKDEKYGNDIQTLVLSILKQQDENGQFRTSFTEKKYDGQDYYPGEAMLGLITYYQLKEKDEKVLEAMKKAVTFYKDYWEKNISAAFIPWQTQAITKLHEVAPDKLYSDFIFKMNDWLVKYQYNEQNSPYKDYIGGLKSKDMAPSSNIAIYLEGMSHAYHMAKIIGDKEREKRYLDFLIQGSGFIIEAQYNPENAYYVQTPEKAIGGFRSSLTINALRIDLTQHPLSAFTKILELQQSALINL